MNDENLVKSGVLDTLAVKNQELAEIKRIENEKALTEQKKLRDQNLVRRYLYDQFPLVSSTDIPEISEKEFPTILSRARRYYLAKIRITSAIALLPIGGAVAGLIISLTTFVNMPPITAPSSVKGIALLYVVGGILATGLLSWLSSISIAKIVKYAKILTKGSRE